MAANTPIIRVSDLASFPWEDISYSQVRELSNGGKMIFVNLNKQPLILHTPKMTSSFGVSDYEDDKKFNLDLTFKGVANNPDMQLFKTFFEKFDDKLISDGKVHDQAWFKQTYKSRDVVEALYTKSLKGQDEKYAKYIKVKAPCVDGEFQFPVYDSNKTKMSINTLEERAMMKGASIQAIIQCTGIWIVDKKFGCNWKVLQMKVSMPNRSRIPDYAFADDDGDEDEKMSEEEEEAPDSKDPSKEEDDLVSSSDDDEEDDLEARVQAPAPVPPPKRTVVSKKK